MLIAVTTVRTVCPCVVGVVAVAARIFSEEQLEQLRSFPATATCAKSPATTSQPSSGNCADPAAPTSWSRRGPLFAFCKKHKTIFRSPVQGLRAGQHPYGIIQPLRQDEVDHAAKAAATPAARLVLVLAAMHAARVKAIRELLLDDADLGNRRLTIDGRTRPIDELTLQVLVEWLSYRNTRWPCTANPHLLINQMSANGTGPSAPSISPRPTCAARPPPWNGSASTGSSRKPWPAGRTRCTWPRCSASTPRRQSATRKTPGSCSPRRPRNTTLPLQANPRVQPAHRA